jgi:5-hydroxyisourate hydrolase-like protein (transthyretin family)/protocatechuate 3,4-dioxygenase beta subunit
MVFAYLIYILKKYIMTKNFINFLTVCLLFLAYDSIGQVSGTVFRDFNGNGTKDNSATFNEIGLAGITVKAYDNTGAEVGNTTTSSTGTYSFTGLTLPLRVEFTGVTSGDFSGPTGTGNATSVQFYTAASSNADYAVNAPSDYFTSTNPKVVAPMYYNGNNQTTGAASTSAALKSFNHDATGLTDIGTMGQVGSVWGTAYHRQSGKMFYAAFAKRHVSWGPLGPNGIYVTSNFKTTTNTSNTGSFVDLNAINPAFDAGNPTRNFSPGQGNPTQPNYDADMVLGTGTTGLGDLDASDNGQYLYTVNLNDRKAWRIEIGASGTAPTSASQIVAYTALPNPCTNSTFRPFAVKFYKGELYIGGVCDGVVDVTNATSAVDRNNLKATIYKTNAYSDPTTATWTQVFEMPLTDNKIANLNLGWGATASDPYIDPNGTNNALSISAWHPWVRANNFAELLSQNQNGVFYPEPILSDIEMDIDGSMILGFIDRSGHQGGAQNYGLSGTTTYYGTGIGDILRVYNNNGTYVLENNGTAGPNTTGGVGNGDGPGGGEYYFHDRFNLGSGPLGTTLNPANHDETSVGGLALWPGSGQVINTVFDPITNWESGGIRWYDNTDGTAKNALLYYASGYPATFGKAHGMGDVELAGDLAPIEIGNRVWNDANSNGIQDAGESGISGVTVELYQGTTLVGTTTTDGNGNYYFTNANVTLGGATGILPNTAYCVKVPNAQGGSKQTALGTNALTLANADATANGDERDSDGSLSGDDAEVCFTTGMNGENNHSFDFGFAPAASCTKPDAGTDATALAGGSVTLTGTNPSTGTWTSMVGNPIGATLSTTTSGVATVSFTLVSSGDYYFIYTIGASCEDTMKVTVTLGSSCPAQIPIWVLDEDAQTATSAQHLWSFDNYNNAPATGTDYGKVKYFDATTSTIKEVSTTGDVEAMAINKYTGKAYFLGEGKATGGASGTQVLFEYDLNKAAANSGNIIFKVIGHITRPGSGSLEAISFDPQTNLLYTGEDYDGGANNSNQADGLYVLNLNSLNTNPLNATPLTFIGNITGLGESCDYVDGLEFDDSGNLFVVDGVDDKLYQIDKATGAIIAIADGDIPGGTGSTSTDVETIVWDNLNNQMIGSDNNGQNFVNITIGSSGGNSVTSSFLTTPGMNPLVDFEGSAGWESCPDKKLSIGNLIYNDINLNGNFNVGEGVDGVIVKLFIAGQDPLTGVPLLIDTTTGGGLYLFENLNPASYFVFIPPSEFATGEPLNGLLSIVGDGGDVFVDDDNDENGIDSSTPETSGISSSIIVLDMDTEPTNASGETGTSNTMDDADDDNGNMTVDFGFSLPVTCGSVGNYVWSDLNNNGSNDEPSTAGINGVTVELWNATTNTLVSSTTTANDGSSNPGYYNFTVCTSGDYKVKFPTTEGGNNLTTQTTTAATDDNSDANPADGFSPTFTITTTGTGTDKDNPTIDAGYGLPCGSVGNYVWSDLNNNGTNDEPTTAGINGVTVELWNATTNTLVSSTTTANDGSSNPGYYNFTVCTSGDYKVKFPTTEGGNNLTTQTTTVATDDNSDANPADGFSPTFTISTTGTGTDKDNPTIDAGYGLPCGSVGNYVWSDLNNNGTNDEPTTAGINGVTVELWNATTNTLVSSTTTANDGSSNPGYYNFTVCTSGDYKVKFPTTEGGNNLTTQTTTAATDDNSDANPADGFSPTFTITTTGTGTDKDNPTIDAGYAPAALACLGNYVWNDLNHDGAQNNGEVGVASITVTLYDNANNVLGSTVTDAYGYYHFCDLTPGTYQVGFTLPQNYQYSLQDASGDDATDSDVDPTTGLTGTYTLVAGDNNLTADAGIYFEEPTTASVGNYVWLDTDNDGVQDANETGISGVTVTLKDNSGNVIATTITDANGFYQFTNVTPGTYNVCFTAPTGLGFSPNTGAVSEATNSDADPMSGCTGTFTVNAGDNITYVDAGLYSLPNTVGSLGDRVWYDINQDGVQDAGETGVSGVTVTLYGPDGTTVLATTTTNTFGTYIFNNLAQGQYVVGFSNIPSGYTLTTTAGTDSTTNSDANTTTGLTAVINLGEGQHNMTYDAGIYNTNAANTNSIGDKVWNDFNKDGIQDANEPGVSGVTVTLYDNTNTPIATTSTDKNGNYLFPDLPNGTYSVGFSNIPSGYGFSPVGNGTAATDSDPDPSTGQTGSVSLTGNTHITDLDAGIGLGNNAAVGLGSLGDLVWYDMNGDGIQDPTESGVAGVTVTLYESDGTTVLSTTTTDALGNYIFTGLQSGGYVVGFTNLPSGYTISPKDADTEGLIGESNSDVNVGTQKTDVVLLGLGEDKMYVDMGIVPPTGTASLGNYVWFDLNNDGLQDANEPGVQGVSVTLCDINGAPLESTTTNANGEYYFVGLTPDTYAVKFSNLPVGYTFTTQDADVQGINGALNSDANPATGKTATVTLASGDNNLNLDAGIVSTTVASVGDYVWFDTNQDGIQDANEVGLGGVLVTLYDNTNTAVASTITKPDGSYIFTNVTPGDYTMGFTNIPTGMVFTQQVGGPTDNNNSNVNPTTGLTASFTVTAGTHNPTIDAGLTTPIAAGLGDYVWYDVNQDGQQTSGEPAIAGVLATLYASDGTTVLATAVTDGNGAYSFTNLPAGTYIVGFSNAPNITSPTGSTLVPTPTSTDNGADGTDSDMLPSGLTGSYTIAAGEYDPTVDAGFIYQFATPVILKDFQVESNNCDATVTWTTSSETNTSHFDVLRKNASSAMFTKIGTVAASGGNSTSQRSYSYQDRSLENGTYHYQLRSVDIDTKTSESVVASIRVNCATSTEMVVYPNPTMEQLNISFMADASEEYTFVLTNALGQVVYSKTEAIASGRATIQISMKELASGHYNLRVSNSTNIQGFKVIKTDN